MSITKIALLVGASVITAGSSAVVATRDKWWPGENKETVTNNTNSREEGSSGPSASSPGSNDSVGTESLTKAQSSADGQIN